MYKLQDLFNTSIKKFMQGAAKKPSHLNLKVLNATAHMQNYSYSEEFKTLDLEAVKKDIFDVMTTSQEWWPADYGICAFCPFRPCPRPRRHLALVRPLRTVVHPPGMALGRDVPRI
jgi:hypothetical protein